MLSHKESMLRTIELSFVFLLVMFVVTQFLIPAIRGTRSLPLFTKERELTDELITVKQQQREKELAETVKEEKGKL